MIQRKSFDRILGALRLRPGDQVLCYVPGDSPPAPSAAVTIPENIPIRGRIRMPEGTARGVILGGVCVSWAVARLPDEDGIRQITVETDPAHRGRGYAVQCLSALRREINEPLLYLCLKENRASAAAAEKAGFVLLYTYIPEKEK